MSLEMGNPFDAIPAFLITLALIPVMGFAVVWIIGQMIMKSMDGATGTLALGITALLFGAAILARNPIVPGAIMVVTITLLAGYPFAEKQLGRQIGREINLERIEKSHAALSARPDNTAAWFSLAECLWRHGWQGHAIAIADQVLLSLDSTMDGFQNRSVRDMFRSEELRLKEWKRNADPNLCQPIACPLCGHKNAPGPIACGGCGKPYLLEKARRTDLRGRFVGRLVMGWALLALSLVSGAWIGTLVVFPYSVLVVLAAVGVAGVILAWIFKGPAGDATSSSMDWS
jgi:hypothetical protein